MPLHDSSGMTGAAPAGILCGVGVGPGEPELVTLKALRVLREADVIAVPSRSRHDPSFAWTIVRDHLAAPPRPEQLRVPLVFPMSKDPAVLRPAWERALAELAPHLEARRYVAFITEGDPLLYSSFIYLAGEAAARWPGIRVEAVPGVSSVTAAAAACGLPLADGMERVAILPATYGTEDLAAVLRAFDTTVLVKVGSVMPQVTAVLEREGLLDRAVYLSRVGTPAERIVRDLRTIRNDRCDYFSIVFVAKRARSGVLAGAVPASTGGAEPSGTAAAAAGSSTSGSTWRSAAAAVQPLPPEAEAPARCRLDRLTKPPGSLGRLESLAARVAALQGTDRPVSRRRAVYVFAADHGIVEEGVSAYPASVTREMVKNFLAGGAAVNRLAASVGAEVVVVDVGIAGERLGRPGTETTGPGGRLLHHRVQAGTASFARGAAMTREAAEAALDVGARLAAEAAAVGVRLAAVGDMGIGNTTATAAVAAALLRLPPERVVGRGTGVDEAGLARKRAAVAAGLAVLETGPDDPLGVLAGVGGLELAAIAGFLIGAAAVRLPVVLDGVITGVAALVAQRLVPAACDAWIAGHRSPEPAHGPILEALELTPLLDLGMRLGEGSGACLGLGLVAAACDTLAGMATFEEARVSGPARPVSVSLGTATDEQGAARAEAAR